MTPAEKYAELSRLLTEHGAALALFAAQWCDCADDCVQEALIRLAKQNSWPDCAVAWLYRATKNLALTATRGEQRRRNREQWAARLRAAETATTTHPHLPAISEGILELEADLREVLIAKIWGRLTFDEIALSCGISKSTAQRRYETAVEQLRKCIGVVC